jgi:hypothetical protein
LLRYRRLRADDEAGPDTSRHMTILAAPINDLRPKGGIPRRDGEPFSRGGEQDVELADASA